MLSSAPGPQCQPDRMHPKHQLSTFFEGSVLFTYLHIPLQASPFAAANYQFQIPPSAPSRDQPHKMTTFGHVETLKERLTGKSSSSHQPKTSSQTSLLSSSSEQSMDCNLQLLPIKSDVLTTINQDGSGDGAGSSSNMSLGSDYSATPGSKTEEKPGKTGKSEFRTGAPRPPLLRQTSASAVTSALYNSAAHAGAFIGLARAKIDFTPPEGDTDSLVYKKGDIIHIMATTPGGHGRGAMRGNVGGFLLTNVELLGMPQYKPHLGRRKNTCKPKPRSVEELMTRIGLEHLAKVFIDNGFDTLEIFSEIDEGDLTTLGVTQPEQRAKLLTAAELLLDSDSADTSDGQGQSGERSGSRNANSDSPSSLSPTAGPPGESPSAKTVSASRDSGCYASSEQLKKMPAGHHGGVSPGTSAVVGPTRLNSRGANGETKCLCVHCGKPKLQGQVSATGRGVVSGGDGEKSDRELSAEDQEVFSITAGSQPQALQFP
ncbi:SAM and SH3 domain-containing protein 3-like [Pomacea canaliculata]|uniref:SAM and SH3 domain-containing protein 3-like n=1 Tax=Pomacea canaliculata TaxID=400727 RepID=UPI000D739A94|nr:SAM and SH3 domain-containing protein 3-like [Pomacea canaliculata]